MRAEVIVVGAGIVGASVAYHAARAGAAVVLLDRARPGSGVTGDSFAWIGGEPREPDASTPLRRSALEEWARLEREVPGVEVARTGSLVWGREAPSEPWADERLVDAEEIRGLEPSLRTPPQRAVLRPTDGAIDPVAVTEALVEAARHHGAAVRLGETVRRLRDGAAGTVVLAAGTGVATLCGDLPVAASPAVLMRFDAPPGVVRTVVSGPGLEVRQTAGGLLLVAAAYPEGMDLRRSAHGTLRRLTETFRFPREVRLVDVRVGMRPMPADGLPIIGPLPGRAGAYVAVMHSAVTLAPVAGRLVAAEVLGGGTSPELEHLRPGRFAATP